MAPGKVPSFYKQIHKELIATLEYKGYTIKTFKTPGKDLIKIYLGDDPVDYNSWR